MSTLAERMERSRNTAIFTAVIMTALAAANGVSAQDTDISYIEEGGITYRVARTKVQRPVREVEWKDQEQTSYQEKYQTQMHSVRQYRYAPITQYQWEPRVHGQWNPFTAPHVAYHVRPSTHWQLQTRTAQVPITTRDLQPITRTVRVPVPKVTTKEDVVESRVAVGPAAGRTQLAANTVPSLAWNLPAAQPNYGYAWQTPTYFPAYPQLAYGGSAPTWPYNAPSYGAYGGIARLDSDPPRMGNGYGASNAGAWQARRDTTESR